MITYLIQLTICWTILFAVYYLFLKRETFFVYNRWFLLAGLVLGLIIPLIDWTTMITHEAESIGHIYVAPVQNQVHQLDVYVATSESTPLWYLILTGLYIIGIGISGIKLVKGIRDIWSLRKGAEISKEQDYELVLTLKHHMPFSFLNAVYWSQDFYRQSSEKDRILAHEARHVSALHSIDILFVEILCVFFWFHPMVYIYRKEIKEVHEYEADAAACILGSKKAYGQLLINQADSGLQLALANHFFYSQLKNRFKMMTRKPSSRTAKLKYLIAIPMIVLAAVVFSFVNTGTIIDGDDIVMADTVPQKKTAIIRNMEAKFNLVKTKWNKQIVEMKYVRDKSTNNYGKNTPNDIAVVRFTLENDGTITHPKVIEASHSKISKEAKAVLSMSSRRWDLQNSQLSNGKEVNRKFVFVEGRWLGEKTPLSTTRTYPDQNYIDLLSKKMKKAYVIIDDDIKGTVKLKNIDKYIFYNNIYSIAMKKSEAIAKKYKIAGDMAVLDIKTKIWADNNPDKIRRGFKTVVGQVVDMEGKPIVGANVMIKGTQKGTVTDFNGEYRLIGADKNDELIFSTKDGHTPREFPVGSHTFSNAIVQFPTVKLYPPPVAVEEVYNGNTVDALPRFPGCEDVSDTLNVKQACANKKMLEFLYSNIKYPAKARDNLIQGQVVVSFVVKKDGSVDYVHIIRDIGAGLGDHVEKLLKKMNEKGKWIPAMKDGKPINFKMTLPVTFELKGEHIHTKIKKVNLDKAVNPLDEIVVVGYSNASVKPHKQFDINEAIQDAIKEGKMDRRNKVELKDKVEGKGIKVIESPSDGSMSEMVITGHPQKNGPISTNDLPPLIVLDGYIIGRADGTRNLKNVDPDNIESISILKDEEAIEKYGDQGKNGVIIITTKGKESKHLPDETEKVDPGKPVLVVLNGNIIGRADGSRNLKHVDPSNIKSIVEVKGQEAIEKYGKEGRYGVAEVTTKMPIWRQKNKELKLTDFTLYPNPASNELTVDFTGESGNYRLEVLDAKGASMQTKEIYNKNHSRTTMNISALNSGVYYLKIQSDSKVTAKVFVKD